MPVTVSKQPDSLHLDLHVEISQDQGEEEQKYHLVAVPHPPAPPRGKHQAPPMVTTFAGEHTFVSWSALLSALRGICPLGDLEVLHSMLLRRKKAKIGSFHLQPADLDVLGFSPVREAGPALI
jgi:hypothetical protein